MSQIGSITMMLREQIDGYFLWMVRFLNRSL
uniref:Uncharacterized protein n=1 Tax=Trichinella nativa TaxID=6335 RepID=A0A0V1KH95_9BILA